MAHTYGIGASLSSDWISLETLSPLGDRSLPTSIAAWAFASASTAPAYTVTDALAIVSTGWTGTATVTIGDSTVIVTPRIRTSSAEVVRDICLAASRKGLQLGFSINTSKQIQLSADLPFTLVFEGGLGERLGFNGVYATDCTYTGDSIAYGVEVAPYGVALTGSLGLLRGGGTAQASILGSWSSGVPGATNLARLDGSGDLRIYGEPGDLEALAPTLADATIDVAQLAAAGTLRSLTRVRATSIAFERFGIQNDKCFLSISAREVSI